MPSMFFLLKNFLVYYFPWNNFLSPVTTLKMQSASLLLYVDHLDGLVYECRTAIACGPEAGNACASNASCRCAYYK